MEKKSAILNMEHLAQYTASNPGLEAELLGLFQAQSRVQLIELRRAAVENDVPAWKFALHTLKGMAQSLGAMAVADAAGALEQELPGVAGLHGLEACLQACELEILRRSA
ncbi:MAG: Hpt domain-containing protein [Aestuariivirgaceae bacterium]|nr:Hpt domain-containing protein [Aestuariivirgaceae bacterium]